jgi:hypothetical protein
MNDGGDRHPADVRVQPVDEPVRRPIQFGARTSRVACTPPAGSDMVARVSGKPIRLIRLERTGWGGSAASRGKIATSSLDESPLIVSRHDRIGRVITIEAIRLTAGDVS